MHDVKNIFLAWVSSITSVFAAIEARDLMTIFSAIVLPILFFTIGKTVDVCLQIYFRRRNERRDQISQNGGKE
jgi:hypothetical protein